MGKFLWRKLDVFLALLGILVLVLAGGIAFEQNDVAPYIVASICVGFIGLFLIKLPWGLQPNTHACEICGYIGRATVIKKGSLALEIILWVLFLFGLYLVDHASTFIGEIFLGSLFLPALFYSYLRSRGLCYACPKCHSTIVI